MARNDFAKARQAIREQEARGAAELARLGQGSNQTAREERELTKQVEQIRARLEEVKRALLNSVIKAPKSGTVIVSNLRHAQQVIRSGGGFGADRTKPGRPAGEAERAEL